MLQRPGGHAFPQPHQPTNLPQAANGPFGFPALLALATLCAAVARRCKGPMSRSPEGLDVVAMAATTSGMPWVSVPAPGPVL